MSWVWFSAEEHRAVVRDLAPHCSDAVYDEFTAELVEQGVFVEETRDGVRGYVLGRIGIVVSALGNGGGH